MTRSLRVRHEDSALNVVAPILRHTRRRPDAVALEYGERKLSYAELGELVARTAGALWGLGVRPGDRIGLRLKDRPEQIAAFLGAAHLGAVAVPLDWRARPAETAPLADGLGLAWMLVEPDAPQAGTCRHLPIDAAWERALTAAPPDTPVLEDADAPFAISSTSGSTGRPKFSQMTHRQYGYAIGGMLELMALCGLQRFLCTSPFYYSGGRNSIVAHLMRGDAVVLHPSVFGAAEYLDAVRLRRITVGAVVPTTVRQLLGAVDRPSALGGLQALFCSGAPLHADEKHAAAERLTPNFQERYGAAETLAIAVLRPADFADRVDSVGQPHSLVDVEVVDEEHRPLPVGEAGRLRVRGPGVATAVSGVHGEDAFRGGWFYPGEIARLDDRDYIFLHGRTSEVMMRSGAKIHPAEVEAALSAHPKVSEVAVLGRRGADNDDEVLAFVVADPGVPLGELIAHCRSRLSPHKVPRHIVRVERLPTNAAGKIDKQALAARAPETRR